MKTNEDQVLDMSLSQYYDYIFNRHISAPTLEVQAMGFLEEEEILSRLEAALHEDDYKTISVAMIALKLHKKLEPAQIITLVEGLRNPKSGTSRKKRVA